MRYAGAAGESVNEVRLVPRENGRQRVEWCQIHVQPAAELIPHRDAFGNEVRWFQLVEPHPVLVVESEAVVEMRPVALPPRGSGGGFADLLEPDYADRHAEFLAPSNRVRWGDPVAAFAESLGLDETAGVLAWVTALEAEVSRRIEYQPGVTAVDTMVEEVVRAGRGVCQDMAHLMIAICRRRGVAARYVSGWLHHPGIEGPGESHAWVEVAVPGIGWLELDPTHPDPARERYVSLALGRDYADVAPLRGSYLGSATEVMLVTVHVRELPG
jgi:transglutaminase-like putative cysteine protease